MWANPLRVDPSALRRRLEAQGLKPQPVPWDPMAFSLPAPFEPGIRWEYIAGFYHPQESVSLIPALLLDAKPGERILDLCAAPGGKTMRMAAAMSNRGTLVANDIGRARISLIKSTVERLGVFNVAVTDWNASAYPRRAGTFDAVLADVPCSCEGTSRKSPESLVHEEGFRERLIRLQEEILLRAVFHCREGGRIVYSTCTYAPEENEAVVDRVLRRFGPSVLRVRGAALPGLNASPGLTEWGGERFRPELERTLRVWPHQNDSGGFYVAVLEKLGPHYDDPRDALPASEFATLKASATADADGDAWLRLLDRFGIRETFENWEWFRPNGRYLHGITKGHALPAAPDLFFAGLPMLRLGVNIPKPSTAAALAFGAAARRNLARLAPEQLVRFGRRETFAIGREQLVEPTGTGSVIVTYDGYAVGTGLYRERDGTLESHFPKSWVRELVAPA